MEIQLDPTIYTKDSQRLMIQRGILHQDETIESALTRTTMALLDADATMSGSYDEAFAATTARLINEGVIVYGTPVLTNAGREAEITAACTVLPVRVQNGRVDVQRFSADSMGMLDKAVGTGYDLSSVEDPAGALLELNDELDRINTVLLAQNKRPVASMATLRADHPGVIDFIRAKREADFSRWRFNLSIFVTEELFEAAEAGRQWLLHDDKGEVTGALAAAELLREVADSAHYCGEPGVLFKDRINSDNPTPHWEYQSTAPCAEVAMAAGEACQFSYINLAGLATSEGIDREKFASAVETMTRLLDASVQLTIDNMNDYALPLVELKRRIGVGITGFADLLIKMGIPYDSQDALDMAANISELLDYHSKRASVELAKERGAFPAFAVSRYLEPEWLLRKMPRSTGAVSEQQWRELFADIEIHGIRNASTTSMPPTGTSSAIVGSSKSLEPHFSLVNFNGKPHRAVEEAIHTLLEPEQARAILGSIVLEGTGMASEELLRDFPQLRTARQIAPTHHLRVQACFQGFLDEALAKTINLPNEASVDDVLRSLWSAYHYDLKGLTVFRDGCLSERDAT